MTKVHDERKNRKRLETNGVPRKLLQKVPATKKDNVDHTNHTIYTKTQRDERNNGSDHSLVL